MFFFEYITYLLFNAITQMFLFKLAPGADQVILKGGPSQDKGGRAPSQDKRGGPNNMCPFKCIDRPKKRGVPTRGTPWVRHWFKTLETNYSGNFSL